MSTRIIGIDFGTSTTVVRVHNIGTGNRIVPVTVNGQRTIPTIAFRQNDSNEMYYGYDAQAKIDSNVEGDLYKNFKMDLISDDDEKRKNAENLIKGFLRYVHNQYQVLLNDEVFDQANNIKVYISHPAKWNSYARSLMKQSVEDAGFCKQDKIFLKDEPTAAILSVIHERNSELKNAGKLFEGIKYKAMMIDMGAGTTDIVLCSYKISNGKLEIDDIFTYPSINAEGSCGGREIDDAIMYEAEKFVNRMQNKPSASGDKVVNKLRRGVKRWKEKTISEVLRQGVVLPEPDDIANFRDTLSEFGIPIMNENERFSISRDSFEAFTHDHWMQWTKLIAGAFTEVKESQYRSLNCPKCPEEVDVLIVTGGHSQWYLVPEYLLGLKKITNLPSVNFKKIKSNPDCLVQSSDPQETVAVGLCYLDEDVVGALAASNDISISFTCEGQFLGACDLIKKGVVLPYSKNDFHIANKIKGNFIFRRELKIDYSIITNKTNKINKSITVPSDGIIYAVLKAALAALGLGFGVIIKLIESLLNGDFSNFDGSLIKEIRETDYYVNLSPEINVNEEGIIKIKGIINVDDEKLKIPEIVI